MRKNKRALDCSFFKTEAVAYDVPCIETLDSNLN